MAVSAKAWLKSPHPTFCANGAHAGVWRRKTVISIWDGKIVKLKTAEEAGGTCCCHIIRLGDEFAVGRDFGDPQKTLRQYSKFTGIAKI